MSSLTSQPNAVAGVPIQLSISSTSAFSAGDIIRFTNAGSSDCSGIYPGSDLHFDGTSWWQDVNGDGIANSSEVSGLGSNELLLFSGNLGQSQLYGICVSQQGYPYIAIGNTATVNVTGGYYYYFIYFFYYAHDYIHQSIFSFFKKYV